MLKATHEKQAIRPPDGAALTYPGDIFVLAVFDHGNASGGSPSLPSSGEAGRPASRSTAGHHRSCPRRPIRPTAASVNRTGAAGSRRWGKFASAAAAAPILSSQVVF